MKPYVKEVTDIELEYNTPEHKEKLRIGAGNISEDDAKLIRDKKN